MSALPNGPSSLEVNRLRALFAEEPTEGVSSLQLYRQRSGPAGPGLR